jgi:hypothetical protein
MSSERFPSGPWTGFYAYAPQNQHRMDLELTFANGNLSGTGSDDIGRFLVKGRYDEATCECSWTKSYIGAHGVFYRGYREGKGIWGRWEIHSRFHGGFHIWPKGTEEGTQEIQHETESRPVEAVGTEHSPTVVIRAHWDGHDLKITNYEPYQC